MPHERSPYNTSDGFDDLDLDETLCEYCYLGRADCLCSSRVPEEDVDDGDETQNSSYSPLRPYSQYSLCTKGRCSKSRRVVTVS